MKYVCSLIVVKDMDVSRNFYEKVLEQSVEYDFGENVAFEGGFALHLESHYKDLVGNRENISTNKAAHNFELYFETDDLEVIHNKLEENQVEFIHEIVEQPWGQRVMRFYDPDLHIVEVGETLESVVLRYHDLGLSFEEISEKTSLPLAFIKKTLA